MSVTSGRQMQRVVVTGMGIVSCLGNRLDVVSAALRAGRSSVVRIDEWRRRGFATQVAALASVAGEAPFDRKQERFMGDTARFACHAARLAMIDARLEASALRSGRAGVVIGSGVGSMASYDAAMATANARGVERTPPYTVPHAMSSTASANVAQVFGVQGPSYSPSSACTTSAVAIGQAMRMIQTGRQDIVLAGGSEALHDNMTLMFDAMGALSRNSNDAPEHASRPYDKGRDGFVIGSGAGVLVLESLEHALQRGASIHAELIGFGHCTDVGSIVSPQTDGIARAMSEALEEGARRPSYVHTHGPSTPLGDIAELQALRQVFGEDIPAFSSTKALSGHPLGASGAHESIYTMLMMAEGFIAGSGEIIDPDPAIEGLPLVQTSRAATIDAALSVWFGFGGSCAALMFAAWPAEP